MGRERIFLETPSVVVVETGTGGGGKLYFLTELPEDRLIVKGRSFFTSPFIAAAATAAAAKSNLARKNLVPLELGVPHIIPLSEKKLRVTLFDSHFSPGSVSLLLETPQNNIFITGNFRYNSDIANHRVVCRGDLDILFFDDDFNNFRRPRIEEVAEKVAAFVTPRFLRRSHPILIGTEDEDLLLQIASSLREKILVEPKMYKILSRRSEFFTADPEEARVSSVDPEILKDKDFENCTGIIFEDDGVEENFGKIRKFPAYNNHASFADIKELIGALKPKSIIPMSGNDDNLRELLALCSRNPPKSLFRLVEDEDDESVNNKSNKKLSRKVSTTLSKRGPKVYTGPMGPADFESTTTTQDSSQKSADKSISRINDVIDKNMGNLNSTRNLKVLDRQMDLLRDKLRSELGQKNNKL